MLVFTVFCAKTVKLKYIGETSGNVQKHIYKHGREIGVGNLNNALLQHISNTVWWQVGRRFDFKVVIPLNWLHPQSSARQVSNIFFLNSVWYCFCFGLLMKETRKKSLFPNRGIYYTWRRLVNISTKINNKFFPMIYHYRDVKTSASKW